MHVEHLDCAEMNIPVMPHFVAHVLVCHTDAGLVLVDTGFGTLDYVDPGRRIGPMRHLLRPGSDDRSSAVRQLERAGHTADDVTHIVLTHLDIDHVGGIADFPHATVHTTADEYAAAFTNPDWNDKVRYRHAQMEHDVVWRTHEGRGDVWDHGLTGHEVLPGIVLVPMPGHSRGHAAVAVDAGDRGWLFHAGDACFDASAYASTSPAGRPLRKYRTVRGFEWSVGRDHQAIRENHRTLARLDAEPDVTVIPAHDQRIFDDLAGGR
ncbi:MBL fold metallo-hydrolase [Aeromicrobium terrae]|nr:MBL fold metallo-hydrolase [Aeromicrobium terrae]